MQQRPLPATAVAGGDRVIGQPATGAYLPSAFGPGADDVQKLAQHVHKLDLAAVAQKLHVLPHEVVGDDLVGAARPCCSQANTNCAGAEAEPRSNERSLPRRARARGWRRSANERQGYNACRREGIRKSRRGSLCDLSRTVQPHITPALLRAISASGITRAAQAPSGPATTVPDSSNLVGGASLSTDIVPPRASLPTDTVPPPPPQWSAEEEMLKGATVMRAEVSGHAGKPAPVDK